MKRYIYFTALFSLAIFMISCDGKIGGKSARALSENQKRTNRGMPSHRAITPRVFGESFSGTTWLLSVRNSNLSSQWHAGATAPTVHMLSFVSDHEIWAYSNLDLGGNTHKVPTYFDPPFDPVKLQENFSNITRYYYEYDKSTHTITAYLDAPEDYDPATSRVYGRLFFNNNPSDPILDAFTTVHYYITYNSMANLGKMEADTSQYNFRPREARDLTKGFARTTWLLNIKGREVEKQWHIGATTANVHILAFVSDHEIWSYTDLDLGGNTHQVPLYVSPALYPSMLATASHPIERHYYTYDNATHTLTVYQEPPETYNPMTSHVLNHLYFNNNLKDPTFRTIGTDNYYITEGVISPETLAAAFKIPHTP